MSLRNEECALFADVSELDVLIFEARVFHEKSLERIRLGQGHVESFKTGFDRLEFLDPIGPASIGLIAFNGLWNYDGWNQLNFVAEEIKVG